MKVPEGEKREQKIENLFKKMMMENVLILVTELDIQAQEVQRAPDKKT